MFELNFKLELLMLGIKYDCDWDYMVLAKLSKWALDHMQLPVSHFSYCTWSFIVWCIIIFIIIISHQVRNIYIFFSILVGRIFNLYLTSNKETTKETNLLGVVVDSLAPWSFSQNSIKVIVNGYKKHDSCGEWWWLCPPLLNFDSCSFFLSIFDLLLLFSVGGYIVSYTELCRA